MNDYAILDCIGDWYGDPGSGWDVCGVSAATKDQRLLDCLAYQVVTQVIGLHQQEQAQMTVNGLF